MNSKLSIEEKKAKFLEQLPKCKGIQTLACRRAGLGRTMLYEYKQSDAEFASKVQEIKEGFTDWVESKLIQLIEMDDRAAIFFYLKANGRNRGYH